MTRRAWFFAWLFWSVTAFAGGVLLGLAHNWAVGRG